MVSLPAHFLGHNRMGRTFDWSTLYLQQYLRSPQLYRVCALRNVALSERRGPAFAQSINLHRSFDFPFAAEPRWSCFASFATFSLGRLVGEDDSPK